MAYILNEPSLFDLTRELRGPAGEDSDTFDVYRLSVNIFEGNFLAVRWALSKDISYRNYTQDAASVGNIDCLRYLRSKGVSWDWRTCNQAASNGHLDCRHRNSFRLAICSRSWLPMEYNDLSFSCSWWSFGLSTPKLVSAGYMHTNKVVRGMNGLVKQLQLKII